MWSLERSPRAASHVRSRGQLVQPVYLSLNEFPDASTRAKVVKVAPYAHMNLPLSDGMQNATKGMWNRIVGVIFTGKRCGVGCPIIHGQFFLYCTETRRRKPEYSINSSLFLRKVVFCGH